MAVFRVEKTRDYTVMSNHHLRNTELSLKAKGLLSHMLSLPENWDYTTKGLSKICKDGIDSISSTIKELEQHGYIIRERIRNEKGQLTTVEYTILEEPKTALPKREKPILDKPILEKPEQENPVQLNTNISNKDLLIMDISNPFQSNQKDKTAVPSHKMRMDTIRAYKNLIKENIDYDIMCDRYSKSKIDEIVELMTETVCTAKKYLRIAGDDYPVEIVKSKLLKLNSEHIEYVLDCMKQNTTDVRNIKKYLLAALFNSLSTIDNYYTSRVSHDMHRGIGGNE